MPSGRCTASTLMTSAPIARNHAVVKGPAQNAVKSSTATPASGPTAGRIGTAGAAIVGRATGCSLPPAPASARSRTPWKRNGARGRIHCSPGWFTNTSRATRCSLRGSSAPLPTIAAGTRASTHAATTSSAVCARVYACSASLTSWARVNRPIIVLSSSSSAMSSRPITCASDRHCCVVIVVMPTYRSSPVGSLPGIITHRNELARPPGKVAKSVGITT